MNNNFRILNLMFTLICFVSYGQDGSNIGYLDFEDLNESFIGKKVHLDFCRNSYGAFNIDKIDLSDKVIIELFGKQIEFKEHREDDGFNNWFNEQYLESTELVNGFKIRVSYSVIENITPDGIKVKMIFTYIGKRINSDIVTPPFDYYYFSKDELSKILVEH